MMPETDRGPGGRFVSNRLSEPPPAPAPEANGTGLVLALVALIVAAASGYWLLSVS
jgi:hypothetical protein